MSSALIGYSVERHHREKFILIKKVGIEVEKSKQILNCVLPAFVRKRVKDGTRYIADDQGIATILFCDIYNFEDIVEGYPLDQLTAFLDDVYRQFDHICELVGVTKVETVGKTYMACAGLKDSESDLDPIFRSVSHARRAVEMAIGIIKATNKIKLINGGTLQVKIGIHSGNVTAGVVGFHKPQFSLVGDTVNTASRMASTIKDSNIIQISEEAFLQIEDKSNLIFTPNRVEAKGKGIIDTYIVKEREIGDQLTVSSDSLEQIFKKSESSRRISMLDQSQRRSSVQDLKPLLDTKRGSIMINLGVEDSSELFKNQNSDKISSMRIF